MNVKIPVRKVENDINSVQAFIKSVVPRGAVKVALAAIVEYMIVAPGKALRKYDPYKYVTRKKAYGQSFQSDKQRRWFWANGGPAMIGNHRTGSTAAGWKFKETNSGYGVTLENPTEGARWIWGDKQARQPALVGHRTARDKIKANLAGAMRHAKAKVNEFLKSRKKGI